MALSFKQSLAYFWEQIGKQFVKNGTIDWAQNDETKSGYIKNRTHYLGFEETGDIVTSYNNGLYNLTTAGLYQGPDGFYNYIGYIKMPNNLIDGSANITGFKIKWNGETYYSKTMYDADTAGYGFGNINIYIQMMEKATGETIPPELLVDLPEFAIHDCPVFGMTLYDPSDGVAMQLFTTKDFGEYMPIELHALVGDGEIKKLDNIYLDENVVITNSEQSNIIAGPFSVPIDDPDASEPSYLLLNPPVINFEKNKTYYITINNETFSSIPTRLELDGNIAYFFGNFTGINDAPEDVYNSPEANYYCGYVLSDTIRMLTIMPREGAEITSSLTVTIAEGIPDNAWLARDKNGSIYWEEKTHGVIKGDGQEIVPVREYTLEELEGLMATQWPQLQEDARYNITFGTATWETVCSSVSEDGIQIYVLGDIYGIMGGQDGVVSNPPIIILQTPVAIEGMYNIIEFDPDFNVEDIISGENVRFGITKCDSIKKLDSKYIDWPNTIPVLSEKDGIIYKEFYDLEGSLNDTFGTYTYPLDSLDDFNWEEGSYYTVKTDNNTALVQCMYYPGDMDSPSFWALVDPAIGSVDGYLSLYQMIAAGIASFVVIYYNNDGALMSAAPTTSLIIRDKQTYINKVNKYAIPNRLPLIPGRGSNSFQSNTYDSSAYGFESIALRRGSEASGQFSLAIGGGGGYQSTRASGSYSIAINSGRAEGMYSIAIAGGATNAEYALAYGRDTIAGSSQQIVLGRSNIVDNNDQYAFILGNGDQYTIRSNALTVNWNGNTWVKGSLFVGGTSETEGASKVATEAYVNGLIVPPILEATAGKENAAGPIGKYASGTPGMNSFTWGVEALAAGGASIAMGTCSTTSSSAHWGVALGTYAASKSGGAIAIGQNVTASNTNAVAIGEGVNVSGMRAVAIGNNLTASNNNQVVLGTYNVSANYSLLLGNGSGSGRSNAFGVTSTGTGYFAGDLYVNGTGTSSTFSNAKKVATESYVDTKVAGLVDSAPTTLNTLNELAAALGDDPNFATTVATEIGKKADKTDLVALTEAEILEVCGVAAVAHVSEVTW